MKRVFIAGVAALAVVFGLNAAAYGALPKEDSKYKGETVEANEATGSILIKSKTKHLLKLIKVKNSCGEVQKVRNVEVKDNGSFTKQIKLDNFDVVIWKIKGKFKAGGDKAKGKITEVACSGSESTFVALIQ